MRQTTTSRNCPPRVLSAEAGSRGSGLVNRSAGKDGRGGRCSFFRYPMLAYSRRDAHNPAQWTQPNAHSTELAWNPRNMLPSPWPKF